MHYNRVIMVVLLMVASWAISPFRAFPLVTISKAFQVIAFPFLPSEAGLLPPSPACPFLHLVADQGLNSLQILVLHIPNFIRHLFELPKQRRLV